MGTVCMTERVEKQHVPVLRGPARAAGESQW